MNLELSYYELVEASSESIYRSGIITSALHPTMSAATKFSSAHRIYVKSLYKRYLTNALDWTINRDVWRWHAMQIRAEFEKNR
jgi:hypothetical protein